MSLCNVSTEGFTNLDSSIPWGISFTEIGGGGGGLINTESSIKSPHLPHTTWMAACSLASQTFSPLLLLCTRTAHLLAYAQEKGGRKKEEPEKKGLVKIGRFYRQFFRIPVGM